MRNLKINTFIIVIFFLTCSACKKSWLDAKPNKSLVVPTSLANYQALLDNTGLMNNQLPTISMVGDGDYSIADATFNSLVSPQEKGAYVWAATSDFYGGQAATDWTVAYTRILQANVVLDGLQKLNYSPTQQDNFNNIEGSALFYRSLDFFDLSQQYCKPFLSSSASNDLGLPLRLSSNVNLTVKRSSVQQTYDEVISDLIKAIPLLPITPLYPTRPSKPAAYGLLARVYLSQENYANALLYADSCLQIKNDLMDLNQMSPTPLTPFPQFNKEVLYHAGLSNYASAFPINAQIVDPVLYQSYNSNDLRLNFYFMDNGDGKGHKSFQGSYFGIAIPPFGGIATDEIYLIRAECFARKGNITAALNDLNTLLQKRYKTGTFTNLSAPNADSALSLILTERHKELCFRNLRWSDLRRLNRDSRFQVTLSRVVNGQNYTLPPNSSRYTLPLDPIETTSGGLEQNPR